MIDDLNRRQFADLLAATTIAAYVLVALGTAVSATLAGGVLAIGANGTFNHVYERDRDRRMNRTADRPTRSRSVRFTSRTTTSARSFSRSSSRRS